MIIKFFGREIIEEKKKTHKFKWIKKKQWNQFKSPSIVIQSEQSFIPGPLWLLLSPFQSEQ